MKVQFFRKHFALARSIQIMSMAMALYWEEQGILPMQIFTDFPEATLLLSMKSLTFT